MKATTRTFLCGFFLLAFSGVLPVGVYAVEPGQITNVQYEYVPGEKEAPTRRMIKRRITKFDHLVDTPGYEVFYVNWDAGKGFGAGATVAFEYRQGRSRVSRVVKFKYPGAVSGGKKTTFNIPLGDTGAGGRVTAWRARVTYDQRILSTRVSPGWSAQ